LLKENIGMKIVIEQFGKENFPMPEINVQKSKFEINLKITDLDFFNEYHNIVQGFLEDNRIDIDIRMYYYDRFYEVCNKYDK
jgi:hypothetical protein